MSIGEKMERDQELGGGSEYYRKRAEEEAKRQLESARRGVTIGALEERVAALERVAGEPLYGDKPGNKFYVDGHEVKTKLEEQIVKHIIKQNERIQELETFVRHHREEVTLKNENHHAVSPRTSPRPPDPTPEMLASPEFEIVWSIIKNWDVDHGGGMRSGATGNDAAHIVNSVKAMIGADPTVQLRRDVGQMYRALQRVKDYAARLPLDVAQQIDNALALFAGDYE